MNMIVMIIVVGLFVLFMVYKLAQSKSAEKELCASTEALSEDFIITDNFKTLTENQRVVLDYIARGFPCEELARIRGLSFRSVTATKGTIARKYNRPFDEVVEAYLKSHPYQ